MVWKVVKWVSIAIFIVAVLGSVFATFSDLSSEAIFDFVFWMLVGLGVFFLPSGIAWLRDHDKYKEVFFVNLIFGGTGVGWILVLVWSCIGNSSAVNEKISDTK